jgi:general secretion pathway protein C
MNAVALGLAGLLEITAVGVVTGARPESGVAILRCAGRTRVVRVGEQVFGARLVSVGADRVTLEAAGLATELRLSGAGVPAAARPPVAGAALPETAPALVAAPGEPVALERTLVRGDVERRLAAEIPRILGETALRPVSEDGRVTGLQLVRVAQGTLLTELGLRPGDVLKEINGTPTDSLPALMGLWSRLQGETSLRASVVRDGRPLELSVNLRPQ